VHVRNSENAACNGCGDAGHCFYVERMPDHHVSVAVPAADRKSAFALTLFERLPRAPMTRCRQGSGSRFLGVIP
jgi:hypothetical protein